MRGVRDFSDDSAEETNSAAAVAGETEPKALLAGAAVGNEAALPEGSSFSTEYNLSHASSAAFLLEEMGEPRGGICSIGHVRSASLLSSVNHAGGGQFAGGPHSYFIIEINKLNLREMLCVVLRWPMVGHPESAKCGDHK